MSLISNLYICILYVYVYVYIYIYIYRLSIDNTKLGVNYMEITSLIKIYRNYTLL